MTETIIQLVGLSTMEIVLGIDNVVFIAIVVARLPRDRQEQARKLGISLALITRIGLLLTLSTLLKLTQPLFTLGGHELAGKHLILLLGGLFLIGKSTHEIHAKLEGSHESHKTSGAASFASIIVQILLLDIVFSLDSVITAVGMAQELWVMVTAMIVAMVVMLMSAGRVSDFVDRHPTIKILALSFLLLIGVMLVAEGLGQHIGKGYIYFAMSFSLFVEMLNIRLRMKSEPVALRGPSLERIKQALG